MNRYCKLCVVLTIVGIGQERPRYQTVNRTTLTFAIVTPENLRISWNQTLMEDNTYNY